MVDLHNVAIAIILVILAGSMGFHGSYPPPLWVSIAIGSGVLIVMSGRIITSSSTPGKSSGSSGHRVRVGCNIAFAVAAAGTAAATFATAAWLQRCPWSSRDPSIPSFY